jgi:hypothetical protein
MRPYFSPNGFIGGGQAFLATNLGKGIAMKGVKQVSKFQLQPDYVVTLKLSPKLNAYIKTSPKF